jgi:hypothetical protein
MEDFGEYMDMTENSRATKQWIHHVMRILGSHTFHQIQSSRAVVHHILLHTLIRR